MKRKLKDSDNPELNAGFKFSFWMLTAINRYFLGIELTS